MTRTPQARTRTETPSPLFHLGWCDVECFSAGFTHPLNGSGGLTSHEHSGFSRSDSASGSPVLFSSVCVARIAARHQVGRVIVRRVPVQMINYQGVGCVSIARRPVHGCAAPVARMRTGPDLVPEGKTGHGDYPTGWRYRVPLYGAHPVSNRVLTRLSKARVVTRLRTEGSTPSNGQSRQRLLTVSADGFHEPIVQPEWKGLP